MTKEITLGDALKKNGVSRRSFLKFCTTMTSLLALPPMMATAMADTLAKVKRQSVIWLSFQECTACTESILRAYNPSIESLIFNTISLDYHHTLQAASGEAAEHAREQAMADNKGKYIVIVDGSIPKKDGGVYSTIAGRTNLDILQDTVKDAFAVVSVGTCAAFGGLPKANPNPTGAVAVSDIVKDKPLINIPGCPPVSGVMAAVLTQVLTLGIPKLDHLQRPLNFFGETIHDRCYRRPLYEQGKFAESFDDEGARKGYCLFKLGCKGPVAYNACATMKWNEGTSFPIQSGHGCFGCSEPNFWDQGGIYKAISQIPTPPNNTVNLGVAATAGLALGFGSAALAQQRQKELLSEHGETHSGERIS